MTVSTSIGRKIPTRSPARTPAAWNIRAGDDDLIAAAAAFVRRRNVAVLTLPRDRRRRRVARGPRLDRGDGVVEGAAPPPARPLGTAAGIHHLVRLSLPGQPQVLGGRAPEPARIRRPRAPAAPRGRLRRSPAGTRRVVRSPATRASAARRPRGRRRPKIGRSSPVRHDGQPTTGGADRVSSSDGPDRPPLRHRHPPDAGDARGDGARRGRRRPVRRGSVDQSPPGASGRDARSRGRTVVPDRDDGEPGRDPHVDEARRRGVWSRARRTSCGTRPAARRRTAASSSRRSELRGRFSVDEFLAARKPRGHMLLPPTALVDVENTHNRAGGVVIVVAADSAAIAGAARDVELASFLDGARLWNAAVALGVHVADLARPFDVVNVAFSKGLGAPGGSMLAGSARIRRMQPFDIAGWPEARCARSESSRQRRTMRWTTTSIAWPTTTRTRELLADRLAASPGDRPRPSDRPDEHRRLPTGRRRARRADRCRSPRARPASSPSRSMPARSAPSPTST